jgi:hypothetical protein
MFHVMAFNAMVRTTPRPMRRSRKIPGIKQPGLSRAPLVARPPEGTMLHAMVLRAMALE